MYPGTERNLYEKVEAESNKISKLIHNFFFFLIFAGAEWPLYLGLAIVAAICVALGAALARGARKNRRLPPYSIARAGKKNSSLIFICLRLTYYII